LDRKHPPTSCDDRVNRARFRAGIGIFIAIAIVASILGSIFGTRFTAAGGDQIGATGMLVALASVYFAIALYAKHWHDRNKLGWWTIPIIGGIRLPIEPGMLEGTRGANQYGPDPLG
jgi:uncharacterized membrane protein YhaH (DUF805 family)